MSNILFLTDQAKEQMVTMLEEHDKQAVRLSLKGGGCAGFKYDWTLADEAENPASTSSCGCGESIGF